MMKTSLFLPVLIVLMATGAGMAQTPSPPEEAPRKWTLSECLDRAMASHPLLKAAQLRAEGAEEWRRYSGVRPNPSLTIQTENWRAWQQPSFGVSRDMDFFVYGTQRLETAGKAQRRRVLADQQIGVARADIEMIRRQLRQEVTRNYWLALHAQMFLEILTENRNDLDQLVQYTSIRVREGFVAESELIRARLEQQTFIGQEASAGQSLERAKLDLLKAMGETRFDASFRLAVPEDDRPLMLTTMALLAMSLEQAHSDALARRPELARLRARVEVERAALKLQRANARPDWELSAGYKRTGGYNTILAYVTIPLPFFNQNRAEIGRAAAMVRSAEQELVAEENYIRAEVEAAHRTAQRLSARLKELQRDFLRQADESRNIALVAYREGATDLYKLLETQRARNEARLLYYRTLQEFQSALAELALAIGGEDR